MQCVPVKGRPASCFCCGCYWPGVLLLRLRLLKLTQLGGQRQPLHSTAPSSGKKKNRKKCVQLNARNVIQGFGMQEEYEITVGDCCRIHFASVVICI